MQPNWTVAHQDREDEDNTPALIQAASLSAIPEVTLNTDLKDIQKADLLHQQVVLHNLNEAWKAARSVKDISMLALTTLKTLQHRREMLLHPTKREKEVNNNPYLDAID